MDILRIPFLSLTKIYVSWSGDFAYWSGHTPCILFLHAFDVLGRHAKVVFLLDLDVHDLLVTVIL